MEHPTVKYVKHEIGSQRIKHDQGTATTLFVMKVKQSRVPSSVDALRTELRECAEEYSAFALIIDLTRLPTLPITDVMNWVQFFVSIRSLLKHNITFTAFITPLPILDLAIQLGLEVYTPIKPFHILKDVSGVEECLRPQAKEKACAAP